MSEEIESNGELNKLDFSKQLHEDVGLAIKLQIRWYFQQKNQNGPKHLQPFLSRNLLYIRRAREVAALAQGKKRKRVRRLPKEVFEPDPKELNLLLDLFKHRTHLFNDALLDEPRRETRRLASADVRGGTPVKNKSNANKKRKHTDSDDDDDSSTGNDDILGIENLNWTWKEKLALNDKTNSKNAKKQRIEESSRAPPVKKVSLSPLSMPNDGLSNGVLSIAGSENGAYLFSIAPATTQMFIHYMFRGDNGAPAIHVEEANDRRCPFCFHNAVSDAGLVQHLTASHGDVYYFQSARSEVGHLHITVSFGSPAQATTKKSLKDFVFVALSKPQPTVPFVERSARNVASLDVAARQMNIRALQEMGATERQTSRYIPDEKVPVRQYFHSKTYQPMVGGDWDIDSDEDSTTDEWLKETNAAFLEDFTDLDKGEKELMKLWNEFIHSHTVVPEHRMFERCMTFIRTYAVKMKAKNLREELCHHLHNLWDAGMISSDHIVECMQEFDKAGDWV